MQEEGGKMTNKESLEQCKNGILRLVAEGVSPQHALEHYLVCAYLNGYSACITEFQEERDLTKGEGCAILEKDKSSTR